MERYKPSAPPPPPTPRAVPPGRLLDVRATLYDPGTSREALEAIRDTDPNEAVCQVARRRIAERWPS